MANKQINKKVKGLKLKCSKCGEEKDDTDYFCSYSPLHEATGLVPICKTCVYQMYNNLITQQHKTLKEATIEICSLLDKPFLETIYDRLINNYDNSQYDKFLGEFFKQVHMQQWRKKGIYRFEHSIYSDETKEDIILNSDEKFFSKEWSGYYTQVDINYLNTYLKGLHDDFKIITTNHKDYAKKIAQASLAMNNAYQDMINGVSGADKRYSDLQKVFDTLSKSAQFSENTRGANEAGITGITQVVDKIESKQWIYDTEEFPKDALDHILDQFANIKKSL